MIYLNQAATSWPKPESVLAAYEQAVRALPSSQFRSSVEFAGTDGRPNAAGGTMEQTRQALGQLLGIRNTGRIFFSSGATDSANALIYGLPLAGLTVLATQTEHNSVLRPLMNLKDQAGKSLVAEVRIVPCDATGYVSPESVEAALAAAAEAPAAVFLNHVSNVTGRIQDVAAVARIVHEAGALLIVDAAQSAGCVPIDVDAWGIDALILTGHKGLYGVQGTGAYYVREGISFRPYRYGGTGRNSKQLLYGENGADDYEYEAGTQNEPGIAALGAGVQYCLDRGVEAIAAHERELMTACSRALRQIPGVTVYGHPFNLSDGAADNGADESDYGPVLSFNISGMKAGDVAYILQNAYGIVVRAGLQCAPLIHQAMETYAEGTVRISVSDFNTMHEIEALVQAVREIAMSVEEGDRP